MSKKKHWLLLLLICIVFVIIWFTRPLWQSKLIIYMDQRQAKLEIVALFLSIITAIIFEIPEKIYKAYKFFFLPTEPLLDQQKILIETSPEKILLDYVGCNAREITWIDRGIITTKHLREFKKIVLVGPMKSGKSREAAEFIQKALDSNLILPSRLYDITEGTRTFTPDILQGMLKGKMDRALPNLIYINDLHKQADGKQIEALTEYLKALQQCSPGYFLATARSDLLAADSALERWIKSNEIKRIDMKPLNPDKNALLVDELVSRKGIVVEDEARRVLINQANGTPYQIISIFDLCMENKFKTLTKEAAESLITESSHDIWEKIKSSLVQSEPFIASLLESLGVFYYANVFANREIVIEFAKRLERKKSKWNLPRIMERRAAKALKLLYEYGVYSRDKNFAFQDILIEEEGLADEALLRLEQFLLNYHRLYRTPLLRRLNKRAIYQQLVLHDLATSYYYKGNIDKAKVILVEAIKTAHPSGFLWSNLGLLLSEQGRSGEAEEAYRKALAADPKYAKAWSNLGVLLKEQGRPGEAEEAYRQALAADPKDAQAWYNLGVLLTVLHQFDEACSALEQAVQLDTNRETYHASLGSVYRKLNRFTDSDREMNQAQVLSSQETVYNRACIAALCGDWENAFCLLEEAIQNREVSIEWIRQDPDWEEARQDERYKKLIR